jgi:hypothetical protein
VNEVEMATRPKPLTSLACRLQAEECRAQAEKEMRHEHRIMLEHIAETWERIAADIEGTAGNGSR